MQQIDEYRSVKKTSFQTIALPALKHGWRYITVMELEAIHVTITTSSLSYILGLYSLQKRWIIAGDSS
jgi:hypothetical protein